MFKTGVVSVSFRQLSVDEVISYTKAAGLLAIEWGSDVHAPYTDMERIEYIAKAQAEAEAAAKAQAEAEKAGQKDPVTVVSREYIPPCDGHKDGYTVITYSDGHEEVIEGKA